MTVVLLVLLLSSLVTNVLIVKLLLRKPQLDGLVESIKAELKVTAAQVQAVTRRDRYMSRLENALKAEAYQAGQGGD